MPRTSVRSEVGLDRLCVAFLSPIYPSRTKVLNQKLGHFDVKGPLFNVNFSTFPRS